MMKVVMIGGPVEPSNVINFRETFKKKEVTQPGVFLVENIEQRWLSMAIFNWSKIITFQCPVPPYLNLLLWQQVPLSNSKCIGLHFLGCVSMYLKLTIMVCVMHSRCHHHNNMLTKPQLFDIPSIWHNNSITTTIFAQYIQEQTNKPTF